MKTHVWYRLLNQRFSTDFQERDSLHAMHITSHESIGRRGVLGEHGPIILINFDGTMMPEWCFLENLVCPKGKAVHSTLSTFWEVKGVMIFKRDQQYFKGRQFLRRRCLPPKTSYGEHCWTAVSCNVAPALYCTLTLNNVYLYEIAII